MVRREIRRSLDAHRTAFAALTPAHLEGIERLAALWVDALRGGRKVLLFGNGGSAADAQHIAAELVGKFGRERRALPAFALTVNSSNLTAIANDYAFEDIFARQLEAYGARADVATGLSTSGNSPNVVRGLEQARILGMRTAALTGSKGGRCARVAEIALKVPSQETARIQEMHITIGHILCEIVEADLFPGD